MVVRNGRMDVIGEQSSKNQTGHNYCVQSDF